MRPRNERGLTTNACHCEFSGGTEGADVGACSIESYLGAMRQKRAGVRSKEVAGTKYHGLVDCINDALKLPPVDECGQASKRTRNSTWKSHGESDRWEAPSVISNMVLGVCEQESNVENSDDKLLSYANGSFSALGHAPRRREETAKVADYFSLLPNDVTFNVVSRICLTSMRNASLVCRLWNSFVLGSELYESRRSRNVREDWIFILGNNMENLWKVYRPMSSDWLILPPCPNDYMFKSCEKECVVAGFYLLVLGQSLDGYKIWKFDIIRSEWSLASRMQFDRCLFGSANSELCAYFAGGTNNGSTLRCAERFNSKLARWEPMPDMNRERKSCSGFMMDGNFFVIGGYNNGTVLECGEAYDPETRQWGLIEGMWPRAFVPSANAAPPLVAVLENELFAINIKENKLMSYFKELNEWQDLGEIPDRAGTGNGWGLGFKAVGNELFVIGGAHDFAEWLPYIHAYRPTSRKSGDWRFVVDLQAIASGFIFNCAVMSS